MKEWRADAYSKIKSSGRDLKTDMDSALEKSRTGKTDWGRECKWKKFDAADHFKPVRDDFVAHVEKAMEDTIETIYKSHQGNTERGIPPSGIKVRGDVITTEKFRDRRRDGVVIYPEAWVQIGKDASTDIGTERVRFKKPGR